MRRLFGTDGVRGIANEFLDCGRAFQIGAAVATVLHGKRRQRPLVLLGCDTRISSSMLCAAVTAGLCSAGADVMQLGVIPTPAVAYLVGKYRAHAGVMISASHNPYEFNGIKLFNEEGFKFPDELEERIESIVLDGSPAPIVARGDAIGAITVAERAIPDYLDHLRAVTPNSLHGLHIAVDCANGSASRTAQELFGSLGAVCEMLSDSPDGVNINDGCGSTHIEALAEYVRAHKLDAGIAFDGDADRLLCVDERGEVVDGDMIIAVLALDMKERGKLARDTVVGTVMTNYGFGRFCEENGLHFCATKVGDRYVLERMLLDGYSIGGEQSGHIIFRDFATTGDGQLTAAQLLALMKRSGKPLSRLASIMHRYPQTLVNLTVTPEAKISFFTDPQIQQLLHETEHRIEGHGRLLVRPSGTEPLLRVMMEGEDEEETRRMTEEVAQQIKTILEC